MGLTEEQIKDIFIWDVPTWSKVLPVWQKALKEVSGMKNGLEIGAHKGGGSLFLGLFGIPAICSDIENPKKSAESIHKKHKVQHLIEYDSVNGMNIKYPDNQFDIVIFKSVIGYLQTLENQQKMISEIYRVLKPGGVLIFAENSKASLLHQKARSKFISWGNKWRYVTFDEMDNMLRQFTVRQVKSAGFFALFVPKISLLKSIFAIIDELFFFIPYKWKYVLYGYAIK